MPSPTLPGYVRFIIVAVDALLAALVFLGVSRLARQPGVLEADPRSEQAGRRIQQLDRFMAVLVGLWVAAALAFTLAFDRLNLPPMALVVYIASVVAIGLALATRTETGRALVAAVPQTWLIGAQVYRAVGAVFLVAAAYDVVPAYFAIPAGWGDIATGLSALAVAAIWARGWFFAPAAAWAWNLFGLGDLLLAIGIGSGAIAAWAAGVFGGSPVWVARAESGFQPFATAIFPIVYPLALIPTFVVPLGILLHLFSMQKLRVEHSPQAIRQQGATTIAAQSS